MESAMSSRSSRTWVLSFFSGPKNMTKAFAVYHVQLFFAQSTWDLSIVNWSLEAFFFQPSWGNVCQNAWSALANRKISLKQPAFAVTHLMFSSLTQLPSSPQNESAVEGLRTTISAFTTGLCKHSGHYNVFFLYNKLPQRRANFCSYSFGILSKCCHISTSCNANTSWAETVPWITRRNWDPLPQHIHAPGHCVGSGAPLSDTKA